MDKQLIKIEVLTEVELKELLGVNDHHLDLIREHYDIEVAYRNETIFLQGAEEAIIDKLNILFSVLIEYIQSGKSLSDQTILYSLSELDKGRTPDLFALDSNFVGRTLGGKPIYPKTNGQLQFVKALNDATIVFAIGPAGTGKTFLAVIHAVTALKNNVVKRIVLTRPAVEAGENLGFLPGDLKEKVDPYLTPLYDALHVMLGKEKTEMYIEKGIIEIAPLAYMRGRTLDDAYIILDEAQNTTPSQMKMFLTRLGNHSRMIITGDITQIDLQKNVESGLIEATKLLKNMKEIEILHLKSEDVVRNPLVQKIIERYETR